MATQPSDQAKQRPRSSPSDELAVIAQRAQAFTNASGAAIALSEGVEDEIVCRARSGSSAPDIGTTLRVEGSFTGLCIQSGKELRCDDAETDTRVDTAAIRALGIRSMVVTPIREDSKVTGVLAVFAPTPHAFTITHVAVLKTMADQIGTLLQKERRAREEGTLHPEPPVTMPKPVAAAPAPVAPPPAPVVIKPSASSAATAAAPARTAPAPTPKVEPIRPVPVAAEVAPPVPFPKKEEKRVEPKIEPRPEPKSEAVPKVSFGTFDAVSGEQKKGGNKLVVIAIAAVVLIAVGVLGFKFLRKSASASASQPGTQTAQNTPSATVPPTTAQPSNTATADNSASQPSSASPGSSSSSTPASSGKPVVPDRTAADRTSSDSRKNDQPRNSSQSTNNQPANNQPASQNNKPAPTPATVALDSGPSRISVRDAQQPAQNAPDVAPSLAVGNGSSPSLSSLAKPTNTAAPSTVKQSDLVTLQVLHKAQPIYPAFARARRVSGRVVVRVTVGRDGKVTDVKFISGNIIFRDAAFDAARQSQYKPAMLNGQPISQDVDMAMDFHP